MKKLIILIMHLLILASCSNSNQPANNGEILLEESKLTLDPNIDTSTIAVETINFGTVKLGATINKQITVVNQSTKDVQLNFQDLKNQLLTNTRYSITSNTCELNSSNVLLANSRCSVNMVLSYVSTEDYTQNISTNIIAGVYNSAKKTTTPITNLNYGKIILSGAKALPVASNTPLEQLISVDSTTLNMTFTPPSIISLTKRFILTNLSDSIVNYPTITPPPGLVITTNTCTDPVSNFFATKGATCYIIVSGAYDSNPANALLTGFITFSEPANLNINTSNFKIATTIINNPPVTPTTPPLVSITQAVPVSSVTNGTAIIRMSIKNISTKTINTALVNGIPKPLLNAGGTCGASLVTGSCMIYFKINTALTANMQSLTRKIKIENVEGIVYAGPTISSTSLSGLTISDSTVCSVGFSPDANGMCVVNALCDMTNAGLNGVLMPGVASVSGTTPSCLVATCNAGYTKAADSKSCTANPIACDMTNAGLNGVLMPGVASVSGTTPSCLVATCNAGYTKAIDSKSCVVSAIACNMTNASANGILMPQVLSVSGNVPTCAVATCNTGYHVSTDTKSCVPDVVQCAMSNALTNGIILANVASVTGTVPTCTVATCNTGYHVSTDMKSCVQDVGCSIYNAGANGVTMAGVSTVTGILPNCTITACNVGYTKAADSKSCIPDICNMTNASSNGVTMAQVASVTGTVPACTVATCNTGYHISADSKSCIQDTIACDLTNAGANGVTIAQVTKVTGNIPSCSVSTCNTGYHVSTDAKSCIQDAVACNMTNASANGITMAQVASVSGNVPACAVATCNTGYKVSTDTKSCVPDIIACDLTNAGANGVTIAQVASVSGSVPNCSVMTCNTGYHVATDNKSCIKDIVPCDMINSGANGITMAQVLNVSGNVPTCSVTSCATGYHIATDAKSCIPDACDMTNASANGVIMTQVASVSGSIPACSVLTCNAGYHVSADSKSCVPDICNMTNASSNGVAILGVQSVKGSIPSCLVDVCNVGYTKALNEASCILDTHVIKVTREAPQAIGSLVLPVPNAPMSFPGNGIIQSTVNYGSTVSYSNICEAGYVCNVVETDSNGLELIPQPAHSLPTDFWYDSASSIIISSVTRDSYFKVKIQAQAYNFKMTALAEDGVTRLDKLGSTYIINLTPADQASADLSFQKSFTSNPGTMDIGGMLVNDLNYNTMINASTCTNYYTSTQQIPHPNCANIKISDTNEFKQWQLPAGLSLDPSSVGNTNLAIPTKVLVDYSTLNPSTKYEIKGIFGEKASVVSTLTDLTLNTATDPLKTQVTIYPQSSDMIEMYPRFYVKNAYHKIASTQLLISKTSGTAASSSFESNLKVQCLISSVDLGAGVGNAVFLNTSPDLTKCFMNNDGNTQFSTGIRLTFDYTALSIPQGSSATTIDQLQDDFRTGSYTATYRVVEQVITNSSKTYTTDIQIPIQINIDNDFYPVMSLTKVTDGSSIFEHGGDTIPVVYNPSNDGYIYELGQSTKKYATSASTTPITVTQYRNMDYNFELPSIADGTNVKISVDLNAVPDKTKAYNSAIRIYDPRYSASCKMVKNKLISGGGLGSLKSINTLTSQGFDFTSVNMQYMFNAETPVLHNYDSTTGSSVVDVNGNVVTSSTTNNAGCDNSKYSGIADVNAQNLEPILGEKFDFQGNDDWICDAGEVCYVNKIGQKTTAGAQIAERTYKVRAAIRSENQEVNFSYQTVRVEKPDTANYNKLAGVNFDLSTQVDNNMDAATMDGLNYSLTNPSLTYTDFKTPKNSSFMVTISNITGLDCTSGCTYSFYKYGSNATATSYPPSSLAYNPMLYSNILENTTFGASASQSFIVPSYELYNHYLDVVAIIKKGNVTYRKMINISVPNKMHVDPIYYAVKTNYDGNGKFTNFSILYDSSSVAPAGNFVGGNSVVVSTASYTEPLRFGYITGDQVSSTVTSNSYTPATYNGLSTSVSLVDQYGYYVQSMGPTNIPLSSGVVAGSFPIVVDVCRSSDTTAVCTSKKAISYDFYKMATVWFSKGTSTEQFANGLKDDYLPLYLRIKTCPSTTPYYFLDQSTGVWGCYSTATAQLNLWSN